jgi:outer membrane protein OmpA-like peptidoglycan-associated protein/biopolymer transport protein ExbD
MIRTVINLTPLLDVVLILLFTFMIKVDADQGKRLERFERDLATTEAVVAQLRSETAALEEEKLRIEGERAFLEAELAEKRAALEELRAATAKQTEEADKTAARLTGERDALSQQVVELAREVQSMSRTLTEEQELIRTRRIEADKRIEELTGSLADANREKENLERSIDALTEKHETLTANLAETQRRNEDLARRLEAVRQEREGLTGGLAALEKERTELAEAKENAEARADELAEAITAAREMSASVEKELETLRVERNEQAARMAGLARQVDEIGRALVAERARVAQLEEEKSKAEAALKTKIARLQKERDALAASLEQSGQAGAELAKELDQLKVDLAVAKLEVEKAKAQTLVSAREITRELTAGGNGAKPKVHLQINFEFNKAELNEQGRIQAEQLGLALTDPAFKGKTFHLVGHTDSRGTDEFNQELSEKRAGAVKRYIEENFQIPPDRIEASGKGESELLYPGDSDWAHTLNRRVEIQVE